MMLDISQLIVASRPSLNRFLAAAINEVTVVARMNYEARDVPQLIRCNEAIHRLSGHLRDLVDPNEPMTASRAAGVMEQIDVLSAITIGRILHYAPLEMD